MGSSVIDTSTVTPTPAGRLHPDGLGDLHVLHQHRLHRHGAPRPGAGPWSAGCHPTRPPRGRWRRAPTASRPSIRGDANFAGSTSACEPLTISAGTTATATVINNAAGGAPVTGALPLGSSVFDTSTVTPTPATEFTPTGSVAYTFFPDDALHRAGTRPGAGPWSAGCHPTRPPRGRWRRAPTASEAVFTPGDGNFTGSTSTLRAVDHQCRHHGHGHGDQQCGRRTPR